MGPAPKRERLPIEEKETFRWLWGFRQANAIAPTCPDTRIVSVADREADIDDISLEAQQDRQEQGCQAGASEPVEATPLADSVIRVKLERDPQSGPNAFHKVREQVAQSTLLRTITVDLPATPERHARVVVPDHVAAH